MQIDIDVPVADMSPVVVRVPEAFSLVLVSRAATDFWAFKRRT